MASPPLKGLPHVWADLSLATKGFAVILLPLFALLGGFALLYHASLGENDAEVMVKRTLEVRENIQTGLNDVLEAESAARGFALSQLPDFLERYNKAAEQAPKRLDRIEVLLANDPRQLTRVATLRRVMDEKFNSLRALIDAARGGMARSDLEPLVARGRAIMQELHELIETLDGEQARLQASRITAAEQARAWTLVTGQGTVGLGLAGGLIAMGLFSRSVVRRVRLIELNARCLRMEEPLVPVALLEDEIGQVEKQLEVTSELLANQAKKLRASEERLQAILDQTTAVIYVKDREGRYLLINRHYEHLFGVSGEDVRGRTDAEVFPKQIAAKFRENDLRVFELGRALEFEEVAPHKDGLHTYISIKFPLLDASKRPYAVCGISTDITERKRSEEALRQMNEELARQAEGTSWEPSHPVDFSPPPPGWMAESRRRGSNVEKSESWR